MSEPLVPSLVGDPNEIVDRKTLSRRLFGHDNTKLIERLDYERRGPPRYVMSRRHVRYLWADVVAWWNSFRQTPTRQ